MLRHGLRPLDVGGGDCLFKSISHQLYGDSSHHLEIRTIAVRYLTENPERFVESVVDTPWAQYLCDMSMPGIWADNIVIQAVADAMNLKIHIIESSENLGELTLVESARHNLLQNFGSIFIGHIGEMHYVSGNCEEQLPITDCQPTVDRQNGQQLADKRPTVGRQTANSWLTVCESVW